MIKEETAKGNVYDYDLFDVVRCFQNAYQPVSMFKDTVLCVVFKQIDGDGG